MVSIMLKRTSVLAAILVLGCVSAIIAADSEICLPQMILNKDERMAGKTFRNIHESGPLQCRKECANSNDCNSINFHRESLTCEMNWSDDSELVVADQAWEYVDKYQISVVFPDSCSSVECSVHSTCVLLKSGEAVCVVTGCSEYDISIPNMEILTTCSLVGCQTELSCKSGYKMDNPAAPTSNTSTATCLPNGTWTSVTSSCSFKGCISYANTYTFRENWNFNHPDSTPIYGSDRNNCENACNSRTNFVCVAYYFNKISNRCNLQPHRVEEHPDYKQYESANTAFDEYKRNCA